MSAISFHLSAILFVRHFVGQPSCFVHVSHIVLNVNPIILFTLLFSQPFCSSHLCHYSTILSSIFKRFIVHKKQLINTRFFSSVFCNFRWIGTYFFIVTSWVIFFNNYYYSSSLFKKQMSNVKLSFFNSGFCNYQRWVRIFVTVPCE